VEQVGHLQENVPPDLTLQTSEWPNCQRKRVQSALRPDAFRYGCWGGCSPEARRGPTPATCGRKLSGKRAGKRSPETKSRPEILSDLWKLNGVAST